MNDQGTTIIECGPCLTYRALPKGHPYMIKYHASVSFHTPTPIETTAPDTPGCTVTNLCERHAPKSQAGVTVTHRARPANWETGAKQHS